MTILDRKIKELRAPITPSVERSVISLKTRFQRSLRVCNILTVLGIVIGLVLSICGRQIPNGIFLLCGNCCFGIAYVSNWRATKVLQRCDALKMLYQNL